MSVALATVTSVSANPHRVFARPERGHMRPPLWVNHGPDIEPLKDTEVNSTTGASAPYTPHEIRMAYGFDSLYDTGARGQGQTIAIIDAYDDSAHAQADLNQFCSEFAVTPTTVQIVYASGTQPSVETNWQQEISLDVQWAHAIAPLAKIMLVEAKDSSTVSLLQAVQVAVQKGANVVSMSWGGDEFGSESAYDSYFTSSGVTFVTSSGDNGAGVEWPAASPNVIGVGGTSLHITSSGAYQSETAWTDGGGGLSAYEAQPTWQQGWFQTAWESKNRGVPDVSYLADPNYGVFVVYNGQWYEFGGTSVGAPQWAALIALINDTKTSGNLSGVDKSIYSAANKSGYTINPLYLHDITSGSDGSNQEDYSFPGYDLVTGLGSPVASGLASALGFK